MPCPGSGQDGELRPGRSWPSPRFSADGDLVQDRLTGLVWSRDANPAELPLTWVEALAWIARRNREGWLGHGDWRLPNRRELFSLVGFQDRRPALPRENPFANVFPGWYWTATTLSTRPAHAWYLHLDGGRLFFGGKDQSFLLWPVRGQSRVLPVTGQRRCYDDVGRPIPCSGSGQDGDLRAGLPWPEPRFVADGEAVRDCLTHLQWRRRPDLDGGPVTWAEALSAASALGDGWRLPSITQLESLVDSAQGAPALAPGGSEAGPREAYWSATTSLFEPDWAWALYLEHGAVGVGQKHGPHFRVWAVRYP